MSNKVTPLSDAEKLALRNKAKAELDTGGGYPPKCSNHG